jgi:tetratricopeptide (TPR) repeat protein
VHAAYQVADRFPDGQLFVDLRGHVAADALPPGEALAYLLRSLGTAASAVPDAVAERAAQYRSKLENSRTLIVLDNAADAEQVRPLLPGAPGCLVLITSRNRLVLEDARSLTLDSLGELDAVALLRKVAGRELGDAEEIKALARLCGCVPLALRIVAARLRHDAALTVATLIGELRDERGRLEQLSDDERDLTSVFDSAFANLPEAERELLRLLGLLPGPDLDAYAAANLAGTDVDTAEGLLESLLARNLLIQQKAERYGLHDLVRAYAKTLIEPGSQTAAAKDRLIGFYERAAWTANRLLARVTEPRTAPRGEPSGPLPDLADRDAALSWLRRERPNLLAAATSQAVDPARRVHLLGSLAELLYQDGPYPQATALHQTAAREAAALGDRLAEANALLAFGRANAFCTTQDISVTVSALDEALAIFSELPNRQGEANARYALGGAYYNLGRNEEAATHLRAAVAIYQDLGEKLGMADCYRYLIRCLEMQGDSRMSLHYCHEALALCRAEGDRHGEALALSSLGRCELESGYLGEAAGHLNEALDIMRERGSRRHKAGFLLTLGRVHENAGDYDAANAALGEALEIYRSVGYVLGMASTQVYLGTVARAAGDHRAAIELFEQSLEGFATTDHQSSIASIKCELGLAYYLAGDPRGVPLIEESLRLITEGKFGVYGHSTAVATLAQVAEAEGDTRRALELFREALPLTRQMIAVLVEVRVLDGLSRCAALLGERDAAREALREAVAIYRRMDAPELAEAEERLAVLDGRGPV